MAVLKKHQCIPFLATAVTPGTSNSDPTYTWSRIDKSTVFALNSNPQTETYDYICDELPSEVVDRYQPELPQEILMDSDNPIYKFVFNMFFDLPIGSECDVPLLICFPPYNDDSGSTTVEVKKAWMLPNASIVLGEMNTIDKKITFTIKLNGTVKRGTYTITGGVPTFTEST